jgi:hypothetical protein
MRASGYERLDSDWYVEAAWIVDALLDKEPIGKGTSCWDPSCGAGNIPKRLAARGIECAASDIADRGFGQVRDFFDCGEEASAEIIISNPPYANIEKYIEHALLLASDRVIVLARLALLEGRARRLFFETTPLARVYVSSGRVSMPPGGSDVRAAGGSVAFAWFVWQHGWLDKPVLDWV